MTTKLSTFLNSAIPISTAPGSTVRYDINYQNLSNTEQQNARTNIGLATVAATGNYNDLINKPVITAPTGFVIDGGHPSSVYGGLVSFDFGGVNG